jgi:hypothetical protein
MPHNSFPFLDHFFLLTRVGARPTIPQLLGLIICYVNSYVAYKQTAPLRTADMLQKIEDEYDNGVELSHQRTHLLSILWTIQHKPLWLEAVLELQIERQRPDGSWDSAVTQTGYNLGT